MSIIHWIGIDDHADKWSIAQFRGDEDRPAREFELVPDESGYRRLGKFLKELDGEVRVAYEAGPCGYELCRRLNRAGIQCRVAAPALTPRKAGERVKTNRRDAIKIARLQRAGELTYVVVPDEERESLRDLIRSREAVVKDVGRVRKRSSICCCDTAIGIARDSRGPCGSGRGSRRCNSRGRTAASCWQR